MQNRHHKQLQSLPLHKPPEAKNPPTGVLRKTNDQMLLLLLFPLPPLLMLPEEGSGAR